MVAMVLLRALQVAFAGLLLLCLPALAAAQSYASIPVTPRRMWETYNGFCGETTVQMIAAANGIWIGQRQARTLRGATFTSQDLIILGPGSKSVDAMEGLLGLLGFNYTSRFIPATSVRSGGRTQLVVQQSDLKDLMTWSKLNIIAGRGIALGVSAYGETDTEYDHIIPAYAIQYADPVAYSPSDVLTLTDDYLNVVQRSMDITAKPFFDSENPVTGCQIPLNPGGGCITTDNNLYAVAIKGLKQPSPTAAPLYQPLQLTITAWVNDATPAAAEPYNKNTAGRYQLDARGCANSGQTFTIFKFTGHTTFLTLSGSGSSTMGSPPATLSALRSKCTAAGTACKSKSYVMGSTSNGLLDEGPLGVLYSSSVVYFVCIKG